MAEVIDWLQFVHCRGIGPGTVHKLLQGFDAAEDILRASDGKLAQAGLSDKIIKALRNVDADRIDLDLEWVQAQADRHIVAFDSSLYPPMLRQIADPPLVLYVRGDLEVLRTPQLAIVGTRKPSRSAANHATTFAAQLTGYGLTICSGLANGIDACAHQGALSAGGLTVAVTATGLDRVYPANHQSLAREIVETGAIVSEFPIGTNPLPGYFPRRNRIISGLCFGTLVVEAALKSGTLTTAAHALDQSREVFAIPGSIDNPLSRGCHALIRNGATLVESIDDILVQLAPLIPASIDFEHPPAANNQRKPGQSQKHSQNDGGDDEYQTDSDHRTANQPRTTETETNQPKKGKETPAKLSDQTLAVLNALDYTPLSLDAVVDTTGLDIVTVTNLAFDLELNGDIVAVAGGKYVKTGATG